MKEIKPSRRLKLIPTAVFSWARKRIQRLRLRTKDPEEIFTDYYTRNQWRGTESRSGTGSGSEQTTFVADSLPTVLRDFGIRRMLDIPCGDFFWMKNIDLNGIEYIGADVVEEMIEDNRRQFGKPNIHFVKTNLINDPLPEADLVFCRDCLVHFSLDDARLAFENICRSPATYLLTTTFTNRTNNPDIATGQWRPLNLQAPPFSLPEPIKTIDERCTEAEGRYRDKALALWKMDDIRRATSTWLDN